jgi:hypothetical protein
MRIGLIGASTNVNTRVAKAKELYSSDYFFSSLLDYAQRILKCDKIYILSPLHGLVSLQDVVAPQEKSITDLEDIQRYD